MAKKTLLAVPHSPHRASVSRCATMWELKTAAAMSLLGAGALLLVLHYGHTSVREGAEVDYASAQTSDGESEGESNNNSKRHDWHADDFVVGGCGLRCCRDRWRSRTCKVRAMQHLISSHLITLTTFHRAIILAPHAHCVQAGRLTI
jgi:hypothetical protein